MSQCRPAGRRGGRASPPGDDGGCPACGGRRSPSSRGCRSSTSPARSRGLDRLTDTPVTVVDASWHCVTSNALAYALTGNTSALPLREQNLAWIIFTHGPTRYVRTEEEERLLRLEVVADLREAWVRYPEDTAPGTEAAGQLDLLATIGLQQFS